ncbi:MAG TPA: RNA polymerase sigma factor [Vicinamibacteria bacterium]|nr:RNA polymerase sigma factor [Vicinamibacteria bacterium]
MTVEAILTTLDTKMLTDEEVVRRVRAGESALFEVLMRRHNQRIYRAARAIVRDEAEAEDVMQQAYVNAYTHLDQFAERARFSTWLTRIATYEALARLRRRSRLTEIEAMTESAEAVPALAERGPSPERQAFLGELRSTLEGSVDALPEAYRSVFVLRDVEGLSTAETAECLGLSEDVVKTRLVRARAQLRRKLAEQMGAGARDIFTFPAPRCDRVVAGVLSRLG